MMLPMSRRTLPRISERKLYWDCEMNHNTLTIYMLSVRWCQRASRVASVCSSIVYRTAYIRSYKVLFAAAAVIICTWCIWFYCRGICSGTVMCDAMIEMYAQRCGFGLDVRLCVAVVVVAAAASSVLPLCRTCPYAIFFHFHLFAFRIELWFIYYTDRKFEIAIVWIKAKLNCFYRYKCHCILWSRRIATIK